MQFLAASKQPEWRRCNYCTDTQEGEKKRKRQTKEKKESGGWCCWWCCCCWCCCSCWCCLCDGKNVNGSGCEGSWTKQNRRDMLHSSSLEQWERVVDMLFGRRCGIHWRWAALPANRTDRVLSDNTRGLPGSTVFSVFPVTQRIFTIEHFQW